MTVLNSSMKVMEGAYLRDLLGQPQALASTLAALRVQGRWGTVSAYIGARQWKRIVLTGMGASFHALHPLNLALIEKGWTPLLIETSELIHYGRMLLDDETLVVAVSQSGRSAEILRLLEINTRAPVLGITNTPDSPLARSAGCVLLLQAGVEASVSCKTYVSTLLVLHWLSALACGGAEGQTLRQLEPIVARVQEYLQNWITHTQTVTEKVREVRHLFLVGRGESLAAVGTGALITKEAAHFPAEGMSSASFRHGPMEMLHNQMLTVVFAGELRTRLLNRQLGQELVTKGGLCEEISADASAPAFRLPSDEPGLRPMLEILPVQIMTLALAALAGREAGRFQYASKITTTE